MVIERHLRLTRDIQYTRDLSLTHCTCRNIYKIRTILL